MKPFYKAIPSGAFSKFDTLEEAQSAAQEQAVANPGHAVEIFRCVGIVSTPKEASTFWMDGEGPPEKPRWRDLEVGEAYQRGDEWFNPEIEEWIVINSLTTVDTVSGKYPARRPL